MIYYLVSRKHGYTMGDYLEHWGKDIAGRVRVVPYGALPANRDLPSGTYVFSDIERLGRAQAPLAISLADQLQAAGLRVLNHPATSLRRAALLERLYQAGVNRFQAYPATNLDRPFRFPVFVREENEHSGSLTTLVQDDAQLRRVMLLLTMEGLDPRDLLIVEFCDTVRADGVYRKYSAFRVGDAIFPRHMLFSRSWVQKDLDLLDPPHIEEIRAYMRENPHQRELLSIFDMAKIEYGRIDYGLLGNEIQVWEINTNPIVARPPEQYDAPRLRFHQAFADVFNAAFARLDTDADAGARVPITWA